MARTAPTAAAAATALAVLSGTPALAWPTYLPLNPNSLAIPWTIAIGHYSIDGGGPLNPYGRDFAKNNHAWNLCLACVDSDNDGWTNGWELGDPCGVWYAPHGPHPCWSDDVSHPGNATSVPETRTLDWTTACGYNPCERPDVIECVEDIIHSRGGGGGDDGGDGDDGGLVHAHHHHRQEKHAHAHGGRIRGGGLHEARSAARAEQKKAALMAGTTAAVSAAASSATNASNPSAAGHGQCNSQAPRPPLQEEH